MYRNMIVSKRLNTTRRNKYKLFILILKRSITRVIKENFQILKYIYES